MLADRFCRESFMFFFTSFEWVEADAG